MKAKNEAPLIVISVGASRNSNYNVSRAPTKSFTNHATLAEYQWLRGIDFVAVNQWVDIQT